jgi:beta-ketodecanoyl-[acyl-carrier-protein] synthase
MPHSAAQPLLLGVGVHIPEPVITNAELVESFNAWVATENQGRAARGEPLLGASDDAFIVEASGVRQRHVLEKSGILDPARMVPHLPERADDELSIQAEFGLASARLAIADAGLQAGDIDLVICACAHHQRPYPAIGIEIQRALGCAGGAFDMNVACSSMTFAMHLAASLVRSGAARNALVCSPEIMSGHLNFRDRDTHFIFGDASASVVIGAGPASPGKTTPVFEIERTEIWTELSSNIRSNFGFLNRANPETAHHDDKLVTQAGRKVFKDVVIAASRVIRGFLDQAGVGVEGIDRFWLHQANIKMNRALMRHIAGDDIMERVPITLSDIGNVASPGSVVAFERTRSEAPVGGRGLICSFGAGYSVGALLLKRLS